MSAEMVDARIQAPTGYGPRNILDRRYRRHRMMVQNVESPTWSNIFFLVDVISTAARDSPERWKGKRGRDGSSIHVIIVESGAEHLSTSWERRKSEAQFSASHFSLNGLPTQVEGALELCTDNLGFSLNIGKFHIRRRLRYQKTNKFSGRQTIERANIFDFDHSWTSNVDSGPSYAELMFERFGRLPLLSSLKIYSLGEWDIPWYPFRHIRDINYSGDSDSELIDFLAYSPNIESIDFYVRPRPGDGSPKRQSILLLFSHWPSGTYSTVKTLKMDGGKYSRLYAHEIPTLVPHLRYLENLHTGATMSIPDEFWDRLRKEEIHLTFLSHRQRSLKRMLLSYLVSYTGLRELSLDIWGRSTSDDFQMAYLLANVITSHSWSLTMVHTEPSRSGPWCLDHPMLDALELCHSLQSLHVCVDEARTRVETNNVIDRTLQCVVTLWPNIRDLEIHAVSQSFGFDALRATASRIHKHVLAFCFAQLPSERHGLLFSSDFAQYSIKVHDKKNSIHAFKVEHLKDWGRKEARRILRRKYKFWKRSDDINDA
ncbi:hypothetical protein EV421DRAFT_2026925 [Armillaria borealis]|uniref:Uncharacterized protein n=1 Tax=Armillaria borealis TaxID=47425 RepID=A0AA39IC50_9AGAR|nr:hypothetical protein EV421DRAFT_2026925 [Armillaria borealis]